MADNGAAQSASTQAWPLPSFYFKVSISNVGDISCSEVSGLESEYGLRKAGDLTLKKGVFKDDAAMWDWLNSVKLNTVQREVVTVSLLDESGSPVKTWEAVNAWPKKLTVEGFKSDGNTTSIETLVIAHEGVNLK